MSADADAKRARQHMVNMGKKLLLLADKYQDATTALVDKSLVIAMCAGLSDEMVLRIRCFPDVWMLEA